MIEHGQLEKNLDLTQRYAEILREFNINVEVVN